MRVYVTRAIPQAGLDILREAGVELEVNPHDRSATRGEILRGVAGADGILCLLTDTIDEAVMEAAGPGLRGPPTVRGIANYAVGFDNVDVAAATRRGVPVSNTPGVLTEATADQAWALLMCAARRTAESDAFTRTGRWQGWGPMQFLGVDVAGRTLGIVGAGRIGSAVARRSAGFGMAVLYTDPRPNEDIERGLGARRVDLDTLLAEADFVSLHVALAPGTRHLIGSRELALMKPTAVLVNTSRGPVVDEAALVSALRRRQILAAGLDVYEDEPDLAPGLLELHNAVLCPHIASATVSTRTAMAVIAASNLLAMLRNERAPNCVNPEVYTQPLQRGRRPRTG